MKNNATVFPLFLTQDQIKMEIGDTLSRRFILRNIHSVPPSCVLTIFFRYLPQEGIRFMNKLHQVYSQEQIKTLEVEISNKLLTIYDRFTNYPSPRDILTDVFSELMKRRIQVIVPRNRTTNNTSY